jgi:hypothetical protein
VVSARPYYSGRQALLAGFLVEGEELRSNLLQVLHRRPTELGGLGWVAGALPAPPSGSKAAKQPFCPGGDR